jgi:hypothetical protein
MHETSSLLIMYAFMRTYFQGQKDTQIRPVICFEYILALM